MMQQQGHSVRTFYRRLWLGIGTAVLVASTDAPLPAAEPASKSNPGPVPTGPGRGGETYLSDGGPSDSRVRYIRNLTLLTGQILIADDLVAAGLWADALNHILDQTAEHRERIQPYLQLHGVLPLAADLAVTVDAIEAQDAQGYKVARIALDERLTAARHLVRKFATPHHRFALRGIVETLKGAAGAYEATLDGDRIVNVTEYREGRGYLKAVIAALDDIRAPLGQIDAAKLAQIDTEITQLGEAWPTLQPPAVAVLSAVDVADRVARIVELSTAF